MLVKILQMMVRGVRICLDPGPTPPGVSKFPFFFIFLAKSIISSIFFQKKLIQKLTFLGNKTGSGIGVPKIAVEEVESITMGIWVVPGKVWKIYAFLSQGWGL